MANRGRAIAFAPVAFEISAVEFILNAFVGREEQSTSLSEYLASLRDYPEGLSVLRMILRRLRCSRRQRVRVRRISLDFRSFKRGGRYLGVFGRKTRYEGKGEEKEREGEGDRHIYQDGREREILSIEVVHSLGFSIVRGSPYSTEVEKICQ